MVCGSFCNDEVVALVGRWIDQQKESGVVKARGDGRRPGSSEGPAGLNHRRPCSVHSKDTFVLEDRNAATHLLRNALGGQHYDGQMVRATLALSYLLSRTYRDDLTIMVIFFVDVRIFQQRESVR
jgi:pyruvate dehydrogenase phosphatase